MKKKILIIFLSFVLATFLIGFSNFDLQAAPEVNQAAVDYIKSKDPNPWITMALAAVGESDIPFSHLKSITSENAIDYGAPILAITALGEDPRTFPDDDYIAKLQSFWDGNQLGDPALLNDDIFGLSALISSSEPISSQIVTGIKNYIISQQNDDGGWGWSTSVGSDTNMTSMAAMSLISAGVSSSNEVITLAIQYLKAAQNEDGGFPYDPQSPFGTDSDASSDAWVISAIYKLGEDPLAWTKEGNSPVTHLLSLQTAQGYFDDGFGENSFTPITTSYAVIALAGKSYPVNTITLEQFDFRIEGLQQTVCKGKAKGPTAMDIVINAADICNYEYNIDETAFGPYLTRIEGDEASGVTGWLYFVDFISPPMGAADYNLQIGDNVLWYFGEWGWPPTKIEVTKTESTVFVSVQYFNGENWQPLEGATVKIGTPEFFTDSFGQIEIKISELSPGSYQIFTEKDGYVRSNTVSLEIRGENPSVRERVGLRVTLIQIQSPPEDFISFSVTPDEIDFEELKPGEQSFQEVTLTNTSEFKIYLETEVGGTAIFRENIDIGGVFWQLYSTQVKKAESKNFPVQLIIPLDYQGNFGEQQGELIFWAVKL